MKIFITGATGFLGQFLVSALQKNGHEVIGVSSKECDLTRASSLKQYANKKFDRIYHLAAWTQAGDFCLYHPADQWLINQKINTNVLDFWQNKQPQAKIICMGTSCSYATDLPLEESYYMQGTPIDSLYTYAMTKRMILCGLKAIHKQYGLNYLYVIPSTLYGPSYHLDGRQMHFIFDLIRKILRGKLYNEPVCLWGDGEQKRELIHVEDFVRTLLALDSISNTEVNVGSGKEHSIKEFANIICEYVDYPFEKIQFDRSKYVGARSKILTISKLEQIIPHLSFIPLNQGIQQVVDWFYENKNNLLQKTL